MEPTFTPMSLDTQPSDKPTLADALETIGQGSFQASLFRGLSDLDRSGVAEFACKWPEFPEESRVRAVQLMDELAEENVDLNFSRALRSTLQDSSTAVRQLAINALWEDVSAALCDRLLAILESDDSQDVRAAAAEGLGRFAEQASRDELQPDVSDRILSELFDAAANIDVPYIVRRKALESVAVFGSRPEIQKLIAEAHDADDAGFHAAALYAMGRTLDKRWLDILIDELRSEDAEMRYEAARATGAIGDVHAVPALAAAAIDEDGEVREEAIMSLGRIGGPGAERALRRLAESASPKDQEAIEEALGEAGDELI